ncbi:hypothetical protein [Acinetobacter sp. Marseille-Q1618]|uniref:hypothetical protein n=1 Tax=Acinetobacter sp. Marseille-Q1618 TaxID=2697502 RepID=UPI00156F0DC2|nr:hypothetical protein [Acinetobacter sp. Marseille-Q1618]
MDFINKFSKINSSFEIHDSIIYFTYSSFISVDSFHLNDLADEIIKSGFAICIMNSECVFQCRSNKEVKFYAQTYVDDQQLEHVEFISDKGEYLRLSDGNENYNYFYGAYMKHLSELRLFNKDSLTKYIKIYLDDFVIEIDEFEFLVNPEISVYEDGIVIIKYGLVYNSLDLDVFSYIDNILNSSFKNINKLLVSPYFCKLASIAYGSFNKVPFYKRYEHLGIEKRHCIEVDKLTINYEFGEEVIKLIELPRKSGEREDFSTITQTILNVIGYISVTPNKGMRYILLGQKNIIPNGEYWSGRPYVYLINFTKNYNDSNRNNKVHSKYFSMLLARTSGSDFNGKSLHDLRVFNDISVFIESSGGLVVFSKNVDEIATIENYIIDYELINQYLEYGYMINKLLLQKVYDSKNNEDIFILRWRVNMINSLGENTYVGEFRDLLKHGWKEYGIENIQKQIYEAIEISKDENQYRYTRQANRRNLMVMILFGLMAIPTISETIIKPIWIYFGIYLPKAIVFQSLFFFLVTMSLIFILVVPSYWLIIRSTKK